MQWLAEPPGATQTSRCDPSIPVRPVSESHGGFRVADGTSHSRWNCTQAPECAAAPRGCARAEPVSYAPGCASPM